MNLGTKPFWITLFITYLYISLLNWIGHAFIITPFIGEAMSSIHADFSKFRAYYLMITWFVITLGTVYFIVSNLPKTNKLQKAMIVGALISIIADGTWVFTNTAFVPGINPFPFILAELAWHTIHGAGGGILALKIYEWALKRFK